MHGQQKHTKETTILKLQYTFQLLFGALQTLSDYLPRLYKDKETDSKVNIVIQLTGV